MPKLEAPESGVIVRMYRQGHGDSFLLTFRDDQGEPFYLLIDCGYKPGSQIHHSTDDIVEDIGRSTGRHLHVVLVTHEHQDHVNLFGKRFEDFTIDHLWVAWTEDPTDKFANDLREKYHDKVLTLAAAGRELAAAAGGPDRAAGRRIEELLGFETESEDAEESPFAAVDGITNKKAIQFVQDKTGRKPLYLRPFHRPYWLPRVRGVRVFALGPPRDETLLLSLDPKGSEEFHMALSALSESFHAAAFDHAPDLAARARSAGNAESHQPFARRHRVPLERAAESAHGEFFRDRYGEDGDDDHDEAWRRIDKDWLRTAEQLALRLNDEVNNTSLVVAFELPESRQVLLFTGDAQRGNWVSWTGKWTAQNGLEDGEEITVKDLLARTVLYKVGHHGSHNATLAGELDSEYPNVEWMAQGEFRDRFVAMIPANEPWANDKQSWTHPLPSIKQALLDKARGRVFQSDVDHVPRPPGLSDEDWDELQDRCEETSLYHQWTVPDR